MDPDETLRVLLDPTTPEPERIALHAEFKAWLDKPGFPPADLHMVRASELRVGDVLLTFCDMVGVITEIKPESETVRVTVERYNAGGHWPSSSSWFRSGNQGAHYVWRGTSTASTPAAEPGERTTITLDKGTVEDLVAEWRDAADGDSADAEHDAALAIVEYLEAAPDNEPRFVLDSDQAELCVEAIRKTFLFDGWSWFTERNGDTEAALLRETLRALGDIEVDDEIATEAELEEAGK